MKKPLLSIELKRAEKLLGRLVQSSEAEPVRDDIKEALQKIGEARAKLDRRPAPKPRKKTARIVIPRQIDMDD